MMEIEIPTPGHLGEAARRFIEAYGSMAVRERHPEGLVFAFRAPMGAGKTTFISEVCRRLGCDDEPNSPTFSIANVYDTEGWGKVYHLDCYRLDGEEEAFDAGIEDIFASGCPCFVEWPDNIGGMIPADAVNVEITVAPDGSRILRADDGD